MAPLTITVSGESVTNHHPERGILKVAVRADGPQQEVVSKEVTSTSNQLHQLFKELSPKTESGYATVDAPVTTFSSTVLKTWSRVPTDDKDRPLPRVHHATSSFQAIFRNFAKMSEVVGKLVAYPKVEIDSIDWQLTDGTVKALGSESRKQAIRDAIQKAEDYAWVLKREVVVVEITDDGYGSYARTQQTARVHASRRRVNTGGDDDEDNDNILDLTPQQIQFTCSVHVKFEAVSDT